MFTSDLKHTFNSSNHTLAQTFAHAKERVSAGLKTLGIEDATDLVTSIGYLIAGSYGLAMVINLAGLY